MILIELAKVFTLSLIGLTGLILLAGVISEAMKNGLGPAQILIAIPLLLPTLLPYTVPTTTLFATCIVYGRLSADNEILALKAAGAHIAHVIWPAALLGLLASTATMALSLDVIPCTHFLLRSELGSDVEELLYTMLRKDGYLRHPKLVYQIHVNSIDGRTLRGVVFKRFSAKTGTCDLIACAKEAVLHVDFESRQILVDLKHCEIVDGSVVGYVDQRTLPVDMPSDWGSAVPKVRSTEMTWAELSIFYAKFSSEKAALDTEIAKHQSLIDRGKGQPSFAEHIRNLTNENRIRENYLLAIENEWHMRPALALGCLCFALIGCPVGIWLSKSDYLAAFIACFVPIVTMYYPFFFCMINMTRAGKLSPLLGVYNADGLLLLAASVLMWRLARN
jgi:lipopolysaccharide export system permease protein